MTTTDTTEPTPDQCGESVLDLKIKRFQQDVDIAHQIIHGDQYTEVQTENGLVDTFAKKLADTNAIYIERWESALHSMQGSIVKTFRFERSLEWHVVHGLGTIDFQESIRNIEGRKVIANVDILNDNEFVVRFTEPEEGRISVVFSIDLAESVGDQPATQP